MLKALLASLEGLSPEIAALYTKTADGKYLLSVEAVDGYELDNVAGLKTALTSERNAVKTLTTAAEAFKDLDPVAARDAIAKVAEFEKLDPAKDADKIIQQRLDAQKASLLAGFNEEIAPLRASNEQLTGIVTKTATSGAATEAISKHKGNVDLLMPHIASRLKTEIADGKVSVSILGDDGNPMLNNKGEALSVDDYVGTLSKNASFAAAFEATGSGSGAKPAFGGKGKVAGDMGGDKAERRAALAERFPELAV